MIKSVATGGSHAPIYADADFAIVGTIRPGRVKPEGPFGDHLGYYSLEHPFPVMDVEAVFYRDDAVWPLTVVGRPPQEDTTFGQLIHELTDPIIPSVIPGVKAVHAVDAAGVHPLLLAVGSERYMPSVESPAPQELLTQANAILGNGQLSLAKYLIITDDPQDDVDIHDIEAFFDRVLRRIDWRRDLHFQTRTTIDTLDYSGEGFNRGSKVVWAAAGPAVRELATEVPAELNLSGVTGLSGGDGRPRIIRPGMLAIESERAGEHYRDDVAALVGHLEASGQLDAPERMGGLPLIVLCDDSTFISASWNNFLWATFTRSNPSIDIAGVSASVVDKHWGCRGSLIIDARVKPHHAPPLIEDAAVSAKVDARAARGGPLAKYL